MHSLGIGSLFINPTNTILKGLDQNLRHTTRKGHTKTSGHTREKDKEKEAYKGQGQTKEEGVHIEKVDKDSHMSFTCTIHRCTF